MPIPLQDNKGVLLQQSDLDKLEYFGEQAFFKAVLRQFPHLERDLGSETHIHSVMAVLHSACASAIEAGEFGMLEKILSFLDQVLANPKRDSEIENAVAISFLEPAILRQTANGQHALEIMPDRIKLIILESERRGV